MGILRSIVAWLAGVLLWLFHRTCHYEMVDDPRPTLRAEGRSYVMAIRHAHQLGAVLANDEPRLVAMVSRSADGDLLVPSLRLRRIEIVRGSNRSTLRDKGGRLALTELSRWVRQGVPAVIAVDGPKGPRNAVRLGAVSLARETGAALLPLVVIPSRRSILARTWDRFQIPWPFSRIRVCFGTPILPAGDDANALRRGVAAELDALERRQDPDEAPRELASGGVAIA